MRRFERIASFKLTVALCSLGTFVLTGCGGGGSGSGSSTGSGGQLSAEIFWEQPSDSAGGDAALAGLASEPGFGEELPAAVTTVRLDFRPATGEPCCVAIDPEQVEVDPERGRRSVVLTKIPAGPGTLTVAGFPGASATAPPGVFATCELEPAAAASPCEVDSLDGPSFLSEPTLVAVEANSEVNAGEILVPAIPFIITDSLAPAPGTSTRSPFAVGATVAFSGAQAPIETVQISSVPGGPIPVELTACDDATDNPCSSGGDLEVSGIRATGTASAPPGDVTIEVLAPVADGGEAVRLTYELEVSGTDSPTPSPTETNPPATPPATPTATRLATATPTNRPPATPTRTRTPRQTRTPGEPTATPNARCGPSPATDCRQSIEGNRSLLLFSKPTNPDNNRLLFRWERGNFTQRREFGDPGLSTSYAFCIYDEIDGVPTLVRQLFLPPGPDCADVSTACWSVTEDGFRYDDPSGTRNGIEQLDLVAGLPGRATIRFRAGGTALRRPSLPFEQESRVLVQIKNDFESGYCWEAGFSRPSARNDSTLFRDTGDSPNAR